MPLSVTKDFRFAGLAVTVLGLPTCLPPAKRLHERPPHYPEPFALRPQPCAAAEKAWGKDFNLKTYHDRMLSFGAPPVRYARQLLLEQPIQ